MSEGAEIHDADVGYAQDLPPHRAAIPVPPIFLDVEKLSGRRDPARLAIVFSLALHAGFFSAAVIWGQGQPLPDADGITAVIRVQVAEIQPFETVIEKSATPLGQPAQAVAGDMTTPPEEAGAFAPLIAMASTVSGPADGTADLETVPASDRPPLAENASNPPPIANTSAQLSPADGTADRETGPASNSLLLAENASNPPAIANASAQLSPADGTADLETVPALVPPHLAEDAPNPPPIAIASAQLSPADGIADRETVPDSDSPHLVEGASHPPIMAADALQTDGAPEITPERPGTIRPVALVDASKPTGTAMATTAPATAGDAKDAAMDNDKPSGLRPDGGGRNSSSRVPSKDMSRPAAKGSANRIDTFSYRRRVRERVMHNLPEGRWGSGRVIIGFRLSRSGGLLALSVRLTSGNPAIDQAALSCVRLAGPYPVPPPGATPAQLTHAIDFRFE